MWYNGYMDANLTVFIPGGTHLPDNDQWTNRFEIKSASSSRLYVVSQNIIGGHWACSCPGWRTRRHCKHIDSIRKVSPQVRTLAPLLGTADDRGRVSTHKDPTLGYRQYVGARGSEADWQRAFSYRMGIDAARKVVGDKSPRGILGVSATDSFDTIKSAWRRLIRTCHPDIVGNDSRRAEFEKYQGAFEILEHEWIRGGCR